MERKSSERSLSFLGYLINFVKITCVICGMFCSHIPVLLFLSLFSSACYKFLENNAVVKLKDTKELIFHVLGVLIKKYDHGLSMSQWLLISQSIRRCFCIMLAQHCLYGFCKVVLWCKTQTLLELTDVSAFPL